VGRSQRGARPRVRRSGRVIAVETNVLLHAHRSESPAHDAANPGTPPSVAVAMGSSVALPPRVHRDRHTPAHLQSTFEHDRRHPRGAVLASLTNPRVARRDGRSLGNAFRHLTRFGCRGTTCARCAHRRALQTAWCHRTPDRGPGLLTVPLARNEKPPDRLTLPRKISARSPNWRRQTRGVTDREPAGRHQSWKTR
jgi:hypothetical protein